MECERVSADGDGSGGKRAGSSSSRRLVPRTAAEPLLPRTLHTGQVNGRQLHRLLNHGRHARRAAITLITAPVGTAAAELLLQLVLVWQALLRPPPLRPRQRKLAPEAGRTAVVSVQRRWQPRRELLAPSEGVADGLDMVQIWTQSVAVANRLKDASVGRSAGWSVNQRVVRMTSGATAASVVCRYRLHLHRVGGMHRNARNEASEEMTPRPVVHASAKSCNPATSTATSKENHNQRL